MGGRLAAWLDAATQGDLRDGSPRRALRLQVAVLATAAALLALELLLARIYPVFLGNVSAFLSIPAAMWGLSLGALFQHLRRRDPEPQDVAWLLPLLALTSFAGLFGLFFLFNEVFNLTHHKLQDPVQDAAKTASLLLVVTPPFAVGGALLSAAFAASPRDVGRLYAWDLAGSAAACVAVPLLLRMAGLPMTLLALLLAIGAAAVFVLSGRRRQGIALLLVATALGSGAASAGWLFDDRPDPDVLGVRYAKGRAVREIRHAWNEISRVAVVRFGDGDDAETRLIHDDGISNVIARTWKPRRLETAPERDLYGISWALGLPPKRALVIFAGAGQDMMRLYEHAGGDLFVRGVEINPLVKSLAIGRSDPFHLRDFYARRGVDLRIDEGRALLERDRSQYDLIFAASNGAQHAARLGHARRFLDTKEAVDAYLSHLAPGGVLVLLNQPFAAKLPMLKQALAARGGKSLAECAAILGTMPRPTGRVDTLVLRPDGLTEEMQQAIRDLAEQKDLFVHYLAGEGTLRGDVLGEDDGTVRIPTDDRPYEQGVDWAGFRLSPGRERLGDLQYALSWIKVFTVLLFGALSALVALPLLAVPRAGKRLPPSIASWLLISGVAYMQAQIGLMGKLELFLGQPIYAIAVVLASFLLANGAGARALSRREAAGRPLSSFTPPLAAAVLLPLTLLLLDVLLATAISLPTPVKSLIGALSVAPLAFVLGMFYPLAAGAAASRGLSALIPATFGLATLSGAVGGAFATVAVIDAGFRLVVLSALPLYLLLIPLATRLKGPSGPTTGSP